MYTTKTLANWTQGQADAQKLSSPDALVSSSREKTEVTPASSKAPATSPSQRRDASSQTPAWPSSTESKKALSETQPSAASNSASLASTNDGQASGKRRGTWDVPSSEKRTKTESDSMDISPSSSTGANTPSRITPPATSENDASTSQSKPKKDSHSRRASSSEHLHGRQSKMEEGPEAIPDANATDLVGHSAEVFVSAWNPTVPSLLASGGGDASVRIWDLTSPSEPPAVCKHMPATQAKNVSTVAWNPDGTLLASGSYDGILRLWTPQGDLHLVLSMHQGPIFAVRWNRKGNMLLTGSGDGTAIVWDVSSGRTRQQFSLHAKNVLDVQWLTGASDSTASHANQNIADMLFATCSDDNQVHLCKLGEPKPIKSWTRHSDEVNAIRFDPSQTLLATASDDGTAHIYAVDSQGNAAAMSNEPLHVLRGHTEEVYAIAWSPSGPGSPHPARPKVLATASFDNTARLWNGETGACLHVIEGHERSVYALAFSPCGRFLATGGIDHRVFVTRVQDGKRVYTYTGGGPIMDLTWHTKGRIPLPDDTSSSTTTTATSTGAHQLAIAQGDKHLVVLDLSTSLS